MYHEAVARTLSRAQRAMLIAHIDGPTYLTDRAVLMTRTRLVTVGILCYCNEDGAANIGSALQKSSIPMWTRLTEDGRMVLAIILADYAEILVRAGFGHERPITLGRKTVKRLLTRSAYGPVRSQEDADVEASII